MATPLIFQLHGANRKCHEMNASYSPPIIVGAVALRHFVPEDAHKAFVMSQESGLRTWLPDQVYESELAALEVVQFLIGKCRDPGMPSLAPYVLGVSLKNSSELIGHVGLSPFDGQVEIGYAIEDRQQGNGFASDAVRAMSEWALERFALPRVLGIVATDNVASCRVLERADFVLAAESMKTLNGRSGLVRRYEKTRPA
jgi:ribosomal-protein-alanine N-acetyltransferase